MAHSRGDRFDCGSSGPCSACPGCAQTMRTRARNSEGRNCGLPTLARPIASTTCMVVAKSLNGFALGPRGRAIYFGEQLLAPGYQQATQRSTMQRWSVEARFQELGLAFGAEIKTLGYPRASLLAFYVGLLCYNVLSVRVQRRWAST